MTRKDWEEILACYWHTGGTYEIPIEIVNDMMCEFEDLYNQIDELKARCKDVSNNGDSTGNNG